MRELVITYNEPIYNAERTCLNKMTQMSLDYRAANGRQELPPIKKAATWIAYKFIFVAYCIFRFMKNATAKHEIKVCE